MQRFELLLTLRTALLIGGQTTALLDDCSTARLASGIPFIPASALKGALRIEFERLARARGKRICNTDKSEESCRKGQEPCLACVLFGCPGLEGKLRFFDAHPVEELAALFTKEDPDLGSRPTGMGFGSRTGVAVSRKRRTSKERMLYSVETVLPFLPQCSFVAALEAKTDLSNEEVTYLRAAVSSLRAVGRGKSRGLGHLEAALLDSDPGEKISLQQAGIEVKTNTLTGMLLLDLVPQENLMVSGIKTKDNFLDGQDFVPGSHVRGAVAGEFIRSVKGGASSSAFQEVFFRNPAFFSDFYPTLESVPSKPIPLTLRTCKYLPGIKASPAPEESHGARDILVAATAVKLLREADRKVVLDDRCQEPECRAPLVSLAGYYTTADPTIAQTMFVTSQIITKTAINRKRWQSVEGKLYSYQLLDAALELPGARRPHFMGTVANLTAELESCLWQMHGKTIYVGAARSRGLGGVLVKVSKGSGYHENIEDNTARMEQLTGLISSVLQEAGLVNFRDRPLEETMFFSITLVSDLALPPGDWWEELLQGLSRRLGFGGKELCLEKTIAAGGFRGGYSDLLGLRKELLPVVKAGSAFVFSCLKENWRSNSQADRGVVKLLQEGLGILREEGMGRLAFCDEIHLGRTKQD